jgi:large subunit ribosomal protein L2
MAMIRKKPRTAASRFQTVLSSKDLTKKKPEKSLVKALKKSGGRNAYGRITVRHRGGGAMRKYRLIDFGRAERDVPGKVVAIEYDPNRNVNIALISYAGGAKRYILHPEGLEIGSVVMASDKTEAKLGNALPLKNIPLGFLVHNVEIRPQSRGTFVRSAGTSAQIMGKTDERITLKMPSGEIRMVPAESWATVGVLGTADFKNIRWGKAGRMRHRGIRPTVRGMAMNPVDHPHGGGEGRSKSGSHPRSPWGKGAKGTRTRKRVNPMIIRRRKSKKSK